MNLLAAQNLALDLMEQNGLGDWNFRFSRSKRQFGDCCSRRMEIRLSAYLTQLNTDERVRKTLIHELSHAIVGTHHGHDYIWQLKDKELGGDGQRCFSIKNTVMVEGTYVATCKFCGKTIYGYRRMKRLLFCRCTRGMVNRFNPENALVFYLNNRVAAQNQLVETD
jgi:predicted SprT family Zn-dependent metalloprotease